MIVLLSRNIVGAFGSLAARLIIMDISLLNGDYGSSDARPNSNL